MPTAVGRFRTTRILGSGGMGTVLAGHDDALERPVAVKLLHREIGVQHAARLSREAKALAKLSHPNVVTIYEVGTHHDRLFIAMEQVEGETLGAWMRARERSIDEVLDVFLDTGQGLVAAHEQGLVHRDFKPDNVIVGADGRPRILDFGLVHASDPSANEEDAVYAAATDSGASAWVPTSPDDTPPAQLDSLTETGTVLGTPAYMPWEQLRGEKTTEASDQFSFCVSLWEALYGERPFAGETVWTLAQSVSKGQVRPPKRPRGSSRLRRTLARGLLPSPHMRWPDMGALLRELSEVRTASTRRRRSAVVLGAVAVALAGMAWGFTRSDNTVLVGSTTPDCEPASARLAGVWNDQVKRVVEQRFAGSPTQVQEYFTEEQALLDDWAATWAELYTSTCESEEATTAPVRYAKRTWCLDQRLLELQVRATALTDLDPKVAATAASGDYMPFYFPRDCGNAKLVERLTDSPEQEARPELLFAMLQTRRLTQRAKAMFFGESRMDYAATLKREEALTEEIYRLDHGPTNADFKLLYANGRSLAGLFAKDKEIRAFDEAIRLAKEAHNDQAWVLANVWKLWAIRRTGSDAFYAASVVEQLPEWEAALERSGWPIYGTLEFRAWQAVVLSLAGDVAGGKAAADQAIAFSRETFGTEHMFFRRTLQTTGNYLQGTPLEDEAQRYRLLAIESAESAFGPNAYALLLTLGIEVEVLINQERFDEALPLAHRALKLSIQHHGDKGTKVSSARVMLARIHAAYGAYEEVDALLPKIWSDIEHDGGAFIAVPAEFQAYDSAVRGDVDPVALARLRRVKQASDFTRMIIAAVTPVLEGLPTDDALAAVTKAMTISHDPQAQALAQLVRGRLLERAGHLKEASEAFAKAAKCDCVALNGAAVLYAARLGQIRTLQLLGDPSAAPLSSAFRERMRKTAPGTRLLEQLDMPTP